MIVVQMDWSAGVQFRMEDQHKVFAQLKEAPAHESVLRLPIFDRPSIFYTDASRAGTGNVLTQQLKDGLHPVACA